MIPQNSKPNNIKKLIIINQCAGQGYLADMVLGLSVFLFYLLALFPIMSGYFSKAIVFYE